MAATGFALGSELGTRWEIPRELGRAGETDCDWECCDCDCDWEWACDCDCDRDGGRVGEGVWPAEAGVGLGFGDRGAFAFQLACPEPEGQAHESMRRPFYRAARPVQDVRRGMWDM